MPYTTRPLDASTWDAFAELVERNIGIYGGCWCIAYHLEYKRGVSDPRTLKEQLVRAGRAHAALVFDEDDVAQGWCQCGSPEEPGLKNSHESVLFSATVELFEQYGFTRGRQVGSTRGSWRSPPRSDRPRRALRRAAPTPFQDSEIRWPPESSSPASRMGSCTGVIRERQAHMAATNNIQSRNVA